MFTANKPAKMLPRALDDISTELEQYQDHTSRTLDQIENQAKKLEEHSQLENS